MTLYCKAHILQSSIHFLKNQEKTPFWDLLKQAFSLNLISWKQRLENIFLYQ